MYKWFVKNLKKDNKGFTLIELIVVIAILGILTAIAVPKYTTSKDNAVTAAHNANVKTLESAASMYLADNGLPESEISNDTGGTLGAYVQEWPKVPKGLKIGETTYAGTEDYTVTIKTDGTIEVTPPRVKK